VLRTPAQFDWKASLLVAAVPVLLLLAVSGRYGYHRDELYFLVAAEHLSWGYVDQPPLTVALAGLASWVSDALWVLRVLPALMAGACVVLTAALARELGGDRRSQVIAAACVAASSVTLVTGHINSTTTYDMVLWQCALWSIARLLRTADSRLWLVVGACFGIGLLNKTSVLLLAAALAVGFLAGSRARRLLLSGWLIAGICVALLLASPYVAWQAAHDWPQLEIFESLREDDGGLASGIAFLPMQVLMTNPFLTFVWVLGVCAFWRSAQLRPWRPIAIAYLAFIAFYSCVGGKPYYAFGFYPMLYAAGAIWLVQSRPTLRLPRTLAGIAVVGLLPIPLLLPVLPVANASIAMAVNEDAGETTGWPTVVSQIKGAWEALPATERDRTAFVLQNYGEAGAIERYAPEIASRVFSGHNSYWFFKAPSDDFRQAIVTGDEAWLRQRCGSLETLTHLDNGLDVDNEEQGAAVYLCRDLPAPWSTSWRKWRHYSG
jgi:4-amino-4-deoxy-L-arabinose transferase-like glycosyltransferase